MDKFYYKKQLEKARKSALDSVGTQFKNPNSKEQAIKQREGLMRKSSSGPVEGGSVAKGMGTAYMEFLTEREDQELEAKKIAKEEQESKGTPYKGADMSDRDLLALTLQAEAGGEGMEGLIAAGSVIRNRAESGKYGKGIRGVIMKPGQFSAWNGVTGYAGGKGAIDMSNLKVSKKALAAADSILSGNYKDKTGGATHYYNPSVASPKWGPKDKKTWTTIGNHIFGKA